MTSKKITLSILLITSISYDNHITALSDNAYAECYKGKDSEYRYLEFYFIEQPKNLLNAHVQKARAAALTGITSVILVNEYFKNNDFFKQYLSFKLNFDHNSIAAAILALTGFDMYTSLQDETIKHDTLVKFIENFDFHKQHIPASLIPAFEELVIAFNASTNKTFSTSDVSAIFEVIQHIIEHEFAKRYEKEKKKEEGTLGLFKTITDISKNLQPK